jgi:predicted O-methyltransferase YrrM
MQIIEQALSILNNPAQLTDSQSPELETVLTGYSGIKIINLLKELSLLFSHESGNNCYLEVGVFKGLTLLSVAKHVSKISCYGIDNFAFFDPEKNNLTFIEECRKKMNIGNSFLIIKDYEDALENLQEVIGDQNIGVYFIDGPHDYRSQLMCLQLAIPYLHEKALIVVDDCNYAHIRQANRDFLVTHPEFKLLFQSYTRCHPKNMDEIERREVAEQGWWNGINVIVKDTEDRLNKKIPPTPRKRKLYENQHFIHSCRIAKEVPKIVSISQGIGSEKNPLKVCKKLINFCGVSKQLNKKNEALFLSMNTYSEKLPLEELNTLKF